MCWLKWYSEGRLGWHLQVECGPDHIEEGEENKADIFKELGAPVEEKLEKLSSKLLTWLDHQDDDDQFAHPEAAPNKCRDAQGSGVVAEPGKVESNFQSKVLRDLACMEVEMQSKYWVKSGLATKGLKAKNLANPRLL